MKPKYIKHYKNNLEIKRHYWKFIYNKYFRKNKGHLRRNLLRKYFKPLVLNQQNARAIVIDRMTPVITEEELLDFIKVRLERITDAKLYEK